MKSHKDMEQQTVRKFTYSDYVTWDDDKRYELINGVVYELSSPSAAHQEVSMRLVIKIDTFIDKKNCKAFHAPLDVRLNYDTFDDTVVQPDILVVCDKSKIDKSGILGAPDLVIEILSLSTASKDCLTKRLLYLKAGVKEYWIVDPFKKTINVMILENNDYSLHEYKKKDKIKSIILKGLNLKVNEIFDNLEIDEDN